jgi:hypothetical protein
MMPVILTEIRELQTERRALQRRIALGSFINSGLQPGLEFGPFESIGAQKTAEARGTSHFSGFWFMGRVRASDQSSRRN